ncbi:MAG: hypothetical protein AB1894_19485 [Chloroflexota bacterium]
MTDQSQPDPQSTEVGGSYLEGDAELHGGDFVGKDKIISGDQVGQDKIIGFNSEDVSKIIDVLLKHFPQAYLERPEQLDQVLQEFHQCHDELSEWKELHNYLDITIQLYDQFLVAVRNTNRQNFTPEGLQNLQNGWYKIALLLDQLLSWARKICVIGRPFEDADKNSLKGEDWAIKLELARRDIEGHLAAAHDSLGSAGERPAVMRLLRSSPLDESWFVQLMDFTSRYWSLVLGYLHYADDNLRKTATRLVGISQEALRR